MDVRGGNPPTREEIEGKWNSLIAGKASRLEIHDWAAQWVDSASILPEDIMITNALQQLHGFDIASDPDDEDRMKHGGRGRYMHSFDHISRAFAEWRRNCMEYDRDPVEYRRRAIARARMIVAREQN